MFPSHNFNETPAHLLGASSNASLRAVTDVEFPRASHAAIGPPQSVKRHVESTTSVHLPPSPLVAVYERKCDGRAQQVTQAGSKNQTPPTATAADAAFPQTLMPLSATTVPVGALLLGVIAEIHSEGLLIHLPDGLVGWVSRLHALSQYRSGSSAKAGFARKRKSSTENNEERTYESEKRYMTAAALFKRKSITEFEKETIESGRWRRKNTRTDFSGECELLSWYFVGQVVQCVVIAEDEQKRRQRHSHQGHTGALVLSLRPSLFNAGMKLESIQPGMILPASFLSVEDHGYRFSFEVGNLTAFLPLHALSSNAINYASSVAAALPFRVIVSLHVERIKADGKVILCSFPDVAAESTSVRVSNSNCNSNNNGSASIGESTGESRGNKLALLMKGNDAKFINRQQEESRFFDCLSYNLNVSWDAVKPGFLVEGRVKSLGRKSVATISTNSTSAAGSRSISHDKRRVETESEERRQRDVAGVLVSCLGGLTGTLLFSHFGHPNLQLRRRNVCDKKLSKAMNYSRKSSAHRRTVDSSKCFPEAEASTIGCSNGNRKMVKADEAPNDSLTSWEDSVRTQTDTRILPLHYLNLPSEDSLVSDYEMMLKKIAQRGQCVRARVVAVIGSKQQLHLSLLPHLVGWLPAPLPCAVRNLLPGSRLKGASFFLPVCLAAPAAEQQRLRKRRAHSPGAVENAITEDIRVLVQLPWQQNAFTENVREPAYHLLQRKSFSEKVPKSTQQQTFSHCTEKLTAAHAESGCAGDHVKCQDTSLKLKLKQGNPCILVRIPKKLFYSETNSINAELVNENHKHKKRRRQATCQGTSTEGVLGIEESLHCESENNSHTREWRVLYFDRFAAEAVCSNAPHLLKEGVIMTPFDVTPGDIVSGTVSRWLFPNQPRQRPRQLEQATGIVVSLSPHLSAFVPVYQLTDIPLSSIPSRMAPGSVMRLRVLQRVCCRSCAFLDSAMYLHRDFSNEGSPGAHAIDVSGCSSGDWHTSIPLPSSQRALGDCNTLGSSIMGLGGGGGGRLILTAKKSFLKDPHPLLSITRPCDLSSSTGCRNLPVVRVGSIVLGYVQEVRGREGKFLDKGAVDETNLPFVTIGFYSGLKTRLSKEEVRRALLEDGRCLQQGSLVKVRIVKIIPQRRSLRVSLNLSSNNEETNLACRKRLQRMLRLRPGSVIEKDRTKVLAVTEEGVFVAVRPVSLQSSETADVSVEARSQFCVKDEILESFGRDVETCIGMGFIPTLHFSDEVRLAEELHALIQVGDVLPLDCIVLSAAAAVQPGATQKLFGAESSLFDMRKKRGTQRGPNSVSDTTCLGMEEFLVKLKQLLVHKSTAEPTQLLRDVAILSCKPSLRSSVASATFLRGNKALEHVKTELAISPRVRFGYLRKIGRYGLLVSFGAWKITGLVPYSNISDSFIEGEDHLRRLYREGMTIRGSIVSVQGFDDSAGERKVQNAEEWDVSSCTSKSVRSSDFRAVQEKPSLPVRFIVDIRPERMSILQRQQLLKESVCDGEGIGIQMLQGLFTQRMVAAELKQQQNDRTSQSVINGMTGGGNSEIEKDGDWVTVFLKKSGIEDSATTNTSNGFNCEAAQHRVVPGQIMWGRVILRGPPSCVLLELTTHPPQARTSARVGTLEAVTGVVLPHQLPDGQTAATIRAQAEEKKESGGLTLPCVVLDFDPVTSIADVSCRQHLLKPLLATRKAVREALKGSKDIRYAHYIVRHVNHDRADRSLVHGDGKPWVHKSILKDQCRGGSEGEMESKSARELANIGALVYTQDLLFEVKKHSHEKEDAVVGCCESLEDKELILLNQLHRWIQAGCAGHPVSEATIQLETASYIVSSATIQCVLILSRKPNIKGKDLERIVTAMTSLNADTPEVLCLRLETTKAGIQSLESTNGSKTFAEVFDPSDSQVNLESGVLLHMPVFFITLSCHNNTLLPTQPTAEALELAAVDSIRARVALSPIQQAPACHAASGLLLLSDSCWPARQSPSLDMQRPYSDLSQTGSIGLNVEREKKNSKDNDCEVLTEKPMRLYTLQASELQDVEREAVPGKILRARVTHMSATVAFARIEKPKQKLLLKLHAADALQVPSLDYKRGGAPEHDWVGGEVAVASCGFDEVSTISKKVEAADYAEWNGKHADYTCNQETLLRRDEGASCTRKSSSWLPPEDELNGEGKSDSWFTANLLEKLTPGTFIDVQVLRLRRKPLLCNIKYKGEIYLSKVEKQLRSSSEKCLVGEPDRSSWTAEVALLGWWQKEEGNAYSPSSSYVRNLVRPACINKVTKAEELKAKSSGELQEAVISFSACANSLYARRWAVVEAVSKSYLTIHCGCSGQLLDNAVFEKGRDINRQPQENAPLFCPETLDGRRDAAAARIGARGRIHRLDVPGDRRILQDLRQRFTVGNMILVRPLPTIKCTADAFNDAIKVAGWFDRRKPKSQSAESKREGWGVDQCARTSRNRSMLFKRYTVVGGAERTVNDTARVKKGARADTLSPGSDTDVPISLLEKTFDSLPCLLEAWTQWRYWPGLVCWGVVHSKLSSPFALAVQISVVMVTRAKGCASQIPKIHPLSSDTRQGCQSSISEDTCEMNACNRRTGVDNYEQELSVPDNDEMTASAQIPVLAAVHMTEITDSWTSNPVEKLNIHAGQLVKLRLLPILAEQQTQQQLKLCKSRSRSGLPLEASLRMTLVEENYKINSREVDQRRWRFEDLEVGDSVSGLVVSSGSTGVFVAISRSLTLRIKLQNLFSCDSDSPVACAASTSRKGIVTGEDAKQTFPVGTALSDIRIVELKPDSRRIEGSLRGREKIEGMRKDFKESVANNSTISSINKDERHERDTGVNNSAELPYVGLVCEGYIKSIKPFGVFVKLAFFGRGAEGKHGRFQFVDSLCRISEVGGDTEEEKRYHLNSLREGDVVKAEIIKVDERRKRVWISLASKLFQNKSSESRTLSQRDELPSVVLHSSTQTASVTGVQLATSEPEVSNWVKNGDPSSRKEASVEWQEENYINVTSPLSETVALWSSNLSVGEDISEKIETRLSAVVKEKKSSGEADTIDEARNAQNHYGEELNAFEMRRSGGKNCGRESNTLDPDNNLARGERSASPLLEALRQPEDFERAILTNGNCAAVWINYMAYYVKLNDIVRAREIAERAITHINYREEKERFSLWMAYLNMECNYGDAVDDVFRRAVQYNDCKEVHLQMTYIFEKAKRFDEARAMCVKCCEMFPESQKMWVRYLNVLYCCHKDTGAARQVMLQALLRLPRRKHIEFAASCARLEYKYGSKERGQTLFEKLLAEHPKRTDLWSQYLDAHILANVPPRSQPPNVQSIRLLFERITSLQLKPRQMKLFYTRWLTFEKQNGTVEGQTQVRARACQYVQRLEDQLREAA